VGPALQVFMPPHQHDTQRAAVKKAGSSYTIAGAAVNLPARCHGDTIAAKENAVLF
jgi:hypothetical protein